MPAHFDAQNDIDCIYALSAGKLVEAILPEVKFCREGACYVGPATVTRLTALGRQLAEKYERGRLRNVQGRNGAGAGDSSSHHS